MFGRNFLRAIPRLFAPSPKLDLRARDDEPAPLTLIGVLPPCDCPECVKARGDKEDMGARPYLRDRGAKVKDGEA